MESKNIIKALECCQTQYDRNCKECPYEKYKTHAISVVTCESRMKEHLLEFIKNQQAEIEKLKEKQIPKKPTYEETNNIYGALKRTCANCGDVCLISEDAKPFEHYCKNCGQALDWNSTERKED